MDGRVVITDVPVTVYVAHIDRYDCKVHGCGWRRRHMEARHKGAARMSKCCLWGRRLIRHVHLSILSSVSARKIGVRTGRCRGFTASVNFVICDYSRRLCHHAVRGDQRMEFPEVVACVREMGWMGQG